MPTEDELLPTVLELAEVKGWLRAHFRPAKTEKGWRTAVSGDGKGFPDLVLVRERVVFIELKVKGKMPSDYQWYWLTALHEAGAEVYLIWIDEDSEWEFIKEVLA